MHVSCICMYDYVFYIYVAMCISNLYICMFICWYMCFTCVYVLMCLYLCVYKYIYIYIDILLFLYITSSMFIIVITWLIFVGFCSVIITVIIITIIFVIIIIILLFFIFFSSLYYLALLNAFYIFYMYSYIFYGNTSPEMVNNIQ